MSHGPSDMRVPDAAWATQEIKDLILDAWRPDWTKPDHPLYKEKVAEDPAKADLAEKSASMLRNMEAPWVDQAFAALEDAGYEIRKVVT